MVYHILSGCDVYYGLRCINELLDQVLVLLGVVAHRETVTPRVLALHNLTCIT